MADPNKALAILKREIRKEDEQFKRSLNPRAGESVLILGSKRRPEFNGVQAVVVDGTEDDAGRIVVRLPKGKMRVHLHHCSPVYHTSGYLPNGPMGSLAQPSDTLRRKAPHSASAPQLDTISSSGEARPPEAPHLRWLEEAQMERHTEPAAVGARGWVPEKNENDRRPFVKECWKASGGGRGFQRRPNGGFYSVGFIYHKP
eukprot:gnl/MRDRNA2_/MRDRNA2_95180_c0_seq1.p1 gnl/MRDRNA2_/MRDRNA2_95180_c0~~gnl/MRDRNA2_/MRDRNA2_95180_c0_seq1.p1  ORF type:complete len:223 (+),score=35.99 gnl/MRDRNA2_/MRDRNA2_95180_c0_seq1:67-669(+)